VWSTDRWPGELRQSTDEGHYQGALLAGGLVAEGGLSVSYEGEGGVTVVYDPGRSLRDKIFFFSVKDRPQF
jgi:hypothetical protein